MSQLLSQFNNGVQNLPFYDQVSGLYESQMGERISTKDPFYEKIPQKKKSELKKGEEMPYKEIRRKPPSNISEKQRKLWKQVIKRAWYHDRNMCGCMPIDLGLGMISVVSILPLIGSAIAYNMHYKLIKLCNEAGCPKKIQAEMVGNIGLDFVMTLVPILGVLLSWMKRSSTRNAALFDTWLRQQSAEKDALQHRQNTQSASLQRPTDGTTNAAQGGAPHVPGGASSARDPSTHGVTNASVGPQQRAQPSNVRKGVPSRAPHSESKRYRPSVTTDHSASFNPYQNQPAPSSKNSNDFEVQRRNVPPEGYSNQRRDEAQASQANLSRPVDLRQIPNSRPYQAGQTAETVNASDMHPRRIVAPPLPPKVPTADTRRIPPAGTSFEALRNSPATPYDSRIRSHQGYPDELQPAYRASPCAPSSAESSSGPSPYAASPYGSPYDSPESLSTHGSPYGSSGESSRRSPYGPRAGKSSPPYTSAMNTRHQSPYRPQPAASRNQRFFMQPSSRPHPEVVDV